MFCGNCGSRTVGGDRFCSTCGRAHRLLSASRSAEVPGLLESSKTPAGRSIAGTVVEGSPSVDQKTSSRVPQAQPGDSRATSPLPLITNFIALSVVAVMASTLNTAPPNAPPADPPRALHRLKDIAKIDLPIDDAAVDTNMAPVPAGLPRLPPAEGEYIGALSMVNGDTIELRVWAYALATDAEAFASWWNTSGAKEYLDGSAAVQCGRIVIDGAWAARHTQDDTLKLLQQAYPDCTPDIS